jgi:topoisomerase-4 subunit B
MMTERMDDLFDRRAKGASGRYSAKDIEVLEGLEPVRRRPGMYIGGTDAAAMHHLVAEVLDNAMDEAVAGHASRIDIELAADDTVTVTDNGRGIPVDPHPKFKSKSALEVILTTLHSGGKFSGKVYTTSGGLHGVGLSVVNALADRLHVEVARDRKLWSQDYVRGKPKGKLKAMGAAPNRRGTTIVFHPDPDVFGKARFDPARVFRLARSKAYLFRGVEIRWSCDPALVKKSDDVPASATLRFPGGLVDFLTSALDGQGTVIEKPFTGEAAFADDKGRVEWAVTWATGGDGFVSSYCNTVPTPEGGTHEAGLRAALARGLKSYGELAGNRRAAQITAEDALSGACAVLSIFIPDPEFQGQTKQKLSGAGVTRLVEASLKDHFDHFLSGDPEAARTLLDTVVERAEERLRRREEKELQRKSPTRKLRLPGKLTDCTRDTPEGTELFLVEGDSAGGTAKQARLRETQAVLPLRGKILNVASASADKLRGNQELADLVQALGCGTGAQYDDRKLRYERIVIMTDADVDGAHIAALLMTFFFREMPDLVRNGHLCLAMPPLYRMSQGADTAYAMNDRHRDELLKERFKGRGKVEISRFKGLGEMPSPQLRETTMDPARRHLLRVKLAAGNEPAEKKAARETADLVERLMGRKPELRLQFIQENAHKARNLDV